MKKYFGVLLGLSLLFLFFAGCNNPTKVKDQQGGGGFPQASYVWVEIKMDKYPALGDTVEIETKLRFVREDDPCSGKFRQSLEDSMFAKYSKNGLVYVTGKLNFFSRCHCVYDGKSSDALKYISGDTTFSEWMAIEDSASFKAKYKAIKSDTIEAKVKAGMGVINSLTDTTLWWPGQGIGYKCFIIQENIGLENKDACPHCPESAVQGIFYFPEPPAQIQFLSASAGGLGQNSKVNYKIHSKGKAEQVDIKFTLDNKLQPLSELKWKGTIDADKPKVGELSFTVLQNGIWKISTEGTAIVDGFSTKLSDEIYYRS